jgi:hypothetical protein
MIIDDVPTHFTNNHAVSMTLRDYFAAKAMQGIVSRGIVSDVPIEKYTENAYIMADAMMKERTK